MTLLACLAAGVVAGAQQDTRPPLKYAGRTSGRKKLADKRAGPAILRGLHWLSLHQNDAGPWKAKSFMAQDTKGIPCDGAGNALFDIGVTGLALLAFTGDGQAPGRGPYGKHINAAVEWLRGQQDKNSGLIGRRSGHAYIYNHLVATLALVECCAFGAGEDVRKTTQLAVGYIAQHRNPDAAWRYRPRSGENDSSVTSWALIALQSARDIGLEVDYRALILGRKWLLGATDPRTGRTGYSTRGGVVGSHDGREQEVPALQDRSADRRGALQHGLPRRRARLRPREAAPVPPARAPTGLGHEGRDHRPLLLALRGECARAVQRREEQEVARSRE